MTAYEIITLIISILSLMMAFGMFIIALLAYIQGYIQGRDKQK